MTAVLRAAFWRRPVEVPRSRWRSVATLEVLDGLHRGYTHLSARGSSSASSAACRSCCWSTARHESLLDASTVR